MQNTFKAVVKREGDWWIGWIEEAAGVNCQERGREELIESLSEKRSSSIEKRLFLQPNPTTRKKYFPFEGKPLCNAVGLGPI